MAGIESNLPEVLEAVEQVLERFNFQARGPDGKGLGHEMLDAIAEGIHERTLNQQKGPSGEPLAPLSQSYRAWKVQRGHPDLIGVKTGHMLSLNEVKGERQIEESEATMAYGWPGSVDASGNTSREKAEKFTEGPGNQPARPFYELDDDVEQAAFDRAELALDELVEELGF